LEQVSSQDLINDWIDTLDTLRVDTSTEMWQNRKTLVLDSIEVLDYLRRKTSDVDIEEDSRLQHLFDLCQLPCRSDYYERFIRYDNRFYRCQNDWWVECWQTIRMKNLLHKFGLISLNEYLKSESDGREFNAKWKDFFASANKNKETVSLAAFSYLECVRFLLNTNESLNQNELNEIKGFINCLCEKRDGHLSYYPYSNEIRANSLNLISLLQATYPDSGYEVLYSRTKSVLIEMLQSNKWDKFSFTWSTFFLFDLDEDILLHTESMIPSNFFVEFSWITGVNHIKKPRYALLASLQKLDDHSYFEIVKPNPIVYTPYIKYEHNLTTIKVIDGAIQSFKQVKHIQETVIEGNYNENYFRDLLRIALVANRDEGVEYIEKEGFLSSGRTTDLLIVRRSGYDIPVEVKILWRFQNGSYEPVKEIIEQLTDGNFGIIVVINPHTNPRYQSKYQGFDGWKTFIQDHETYINGTVRESDEYYGSLKSHCVYSEHTCNLNGRKKVVTLLSVMIDLTEYIRCSHLR